MATLPGVPHRPARSGSEYRLGTDSASVSQDIGSETLLVTLAVAQGALLLARPSIALVAIGMWWNANTISHNFIHRPFFARGVFNRAFSCYLTLVLGFPQCLWRSRHLAHHQLETGASSGLAERRQRASPVELGLLLGLWGAMAAFAPHFALTVYLPGYLAGLGLCGLQGHYEHVRGSISHYDRLYNLIFFNDGYHIEHHAHPGLNWRDLPGQRLAGGNSSRYPAVLRWLESMNLEALERLVVRRPILQRFVIERHQRAIRSLLVELPPVHRVGIVGGGLFPRTAIILGRLLPQATLTVIDASAQNLAIARPFLASEIRQINKRFDPGDQCDFDLLVLPLSFVGNRRAAYERPPARAVLIHDWLWKPVGTSAVVSWLLLKRVNLVTQ